MELDQGHLIWVFSTSILNSQRGISVIGATTTPDELVLEPHFNWEDKDNYQHAPFKFEPLGLEFITFGSKVRRATSIARLEIKLLHQKAYLTLGGM